MVNIVFKHRDRLILAANPASHEGAIEEAKNLFGFEKTTQIDFYFNVIGVGLAELAPSAWMALQYGSLISVIVTSHGVPESSLGLVNFNEKFNSNFPSTYLLETEPSSMKTTEITRSSSTAFSESDYPKYIPPLIKSCDDPDMGNTEKMLIQKIFSEPSKEKPVKPTRPGFYRCPTVTSPKSSCLQISAGSTECLDCAKLHNTSQEPSEKSDQDLLTSENDLITKGTPSSQFTKIITVQLEHINRIKLSRVLPAWMSLIMEQRFHVIFGKLADLIMEPPERIGLCLIRGSKIINISPLSSPRLLGMKANDRIRVRICPEASSSLSTPQPVDVSNGIRFLRNFKMGRSQEQVPLYTPRKDVSLPSNPRANKVRSQ